MELFGNHLILSCNIVIMSRDGFDPNEMSAWFHVAKAYQHQILTDLDSVRIKQKTESIFAILNETQLGPVYKCNAKCKYIIADYIQLANIDQVWNHQLELTFQFQFKEQVLNTYTSGRVL